MRHSSSLLMSVAPAGLFAFGTPVTSLAQSALGFSPLDSVAAQLVELEFQRLALKGDANAVGQSRQRVDSQIAALHERLRALPNGTAADSAATGRVLLALDTRAEHLRAQLRQARLAYTEEFAGVRQLRDAERAVLERASAIRRGL